MLIDFEFIIAGYLIMMFFKNSFIKTTGKKYLLSVCMPAPFTSIYPVSVKLRRTDFNLIQFIIGLH